MMTDKTTSLVSTIAVFAALFLFIFLDRRSVHEPHISFVTQNSVHYLVFTTSKGIAVVNYTADSMEYELIKSSTKIKDCEESTTRIKGFEEDTHFSK